MSLEFVETTNPASPQPPRIGERRLALSAVDSTNSIAAARANDPANHGLVVTAEIQTAGRGQYDRVWQAPPGTSILMSGLLFPPQSLLRPSILTAWAAVSVCETILRATGRQATIKWPNDVLIDGRKVCGILCEGGAKHIVAGIGLNLNQSRDDFEKMALPDATSLAIDSGHPFDLPDLTRSLIRQLDQHYDRLLRGEIATLEVEWKERIGLLGKSVGAVRMDGSTLHGRLRAISFVGIEIETGDGTTASIPPEAIRHLREA